MCLKGVRLLVCVRVYGQFMDKLKWINGFRRLWYGMAFPLDCAFSEWFVYIVKILAPNAERMQNGKMKKTDSNITAHGTVYSVDVYWFVLIPCSVHVFASLLATPTERHFPRLSFCTHTPVHCLIWKIRITPSTRTKLDWFRMAFFIKGRCIFVVSHNHWRW